MIGAIIWVPRQITKPLGGNASAFCCHVRASWNAELVLHKRANTGGLLLGLHLGHGQFWKDLQYFGAAVAFQCV